MSRWIKRLAIAWGLLGSAATAWAEPPADVQVRLYYSPAFSSEIGKTPADPDGTYRDKKANEAQKVEFELILFRYVGVSAARIPFQRRFIDNAGVSVDESAEERMFSVTLYATESRPDSWNLFAGTGWGEISQYRIHLDGVRQDQAPLHRDLQLRRNFAGFEYTFERLGVRVEVNQIAGLRESAGQSAKLEQQFLFLTFYIPFN